MTHSERVTFQNDEGIELSGILDRPSGEVLAYAIFAHCFTCSKDFQPTRQVSEALSQRSIATLRVDFTGLGESEGRFAATTFSSNIDDLVSAGAFLSAHYAAPQLLLGHSLGGAAVILAAARMPSVSALATIGAPSDPAHVRHLFGEHDRRIEQRGEVEVNIGGRPFRIRQSFVEDLERHSPPDTLAALRRPLLIMHAPADNIVSIEHARRLFEAAYHPKSFVSLDDADHLLRRRRDAEYVAEIVAAWAQRYLDTPSQ